MPRVKACFESGNPLPENLYHHNRREFRHKKFRYKMPDGTFTVIQGSEAEVTKYAEDCNAYRSQNPGRFVNKNFSLKVRHKSGTIGRLLEEFFTNIEALQPSRKQSKKWRDCKGSLIKHLAPIFDTPARQFSRKRCLGIWMGMSFHVQKNLKPQLRLFHTFLRDTNVLPENEANPFVREDADGFRFKEDPKKIRGVLPIGLFFKVRQQAATMGYHFLVDAMDLSFLTYMRVGDILELRFDEHIQNGNLQKVIGKSKSRRKTKPVIHTYRLQDHPQILEVLNRSRMRMEEAIQNRNGLKNPSAGYATPCPFVIHHAYTRYPKSETKQHANQVTLRYLDECVYKCLAAMPELAGIPRVQLPSFHEIRATRTFVDSRDRSTEDIAGDLGHTDKKITESSYMTHLDYRVHEVTHSPSLEAARELSISG